MAHIWMSHVTHEWAMAHTYRLKQSFTILISIVMIISSLISAGTGYTYLYAYLSLILDLRHAQEYIMPHTNESCHAHEWAMSHMWMSHVTHTNGSGHTCESRHSSRCDSKVSSKVIVYTVTCVLATNTVTVWVATDTVTCNTVTWTQWLANHGTQVTVTQKSAKSKVFVYTVTCVLATNTWVWRLGSQEPTGFGDQDHGTQSTLC